MVFIAETGRQQQIVRSRAGFTDKATAVGLLTKAVVTIFLMFRVKSGFLPTQQLRIIFTRKNSRNNSISFMLIRMINLL